MAVRLEVAKLTVTVPAVPPMRLTVTTAFPPTTFSFTLKLAAAKPSTLSSSRIVRVTPV